MDSIKYYNKLKIYIGSRKSEKNNDRITKAIHYERSRQAVEIN